MPRPHVTWEGHDLRIRHRGRKGLGVDEDTERTGAGTQSGPGAACLELVRRRAGAGTLEEFAPAAAAAGGAGAAVLGGALEGVQPAFLKKRRKD